MSNNFTATKTSNRYDHFIDYFVSKDQLYLLEFLYKFTYYISFNHLLYLSNNYQLI